VSASGLAAVLVASLVGSLHCAVMCGPLTALHHGAGRAAAWRGVALHQLGRAVGYAILGAGAGAAGKLVDLAGAALTVQRAAMIGAAGALLVWGLLLAGRAFGRPLARGTSRRSAIAPSWFGRGLVQLKKTPPARRALGLGLLNALLPCGWLWAFVALAAGTGAPLAGAATMLVFWLGTLPALLGASLLAAPLFARLRPRWPMITAALVLSLAATALVLRVPLLHSPAPSPAGGATSDAMTSSTHDSGAAPSCHDPSAVPSLPSSAEASP
jgi:uncharacterized protein